MLRLRVFLILLAFLFGSSSLAADDPVTCVQEYLASAGYPVGKIDGKLGKVTIGFSAEFAAVYPELKLPKLSKSNAVKWCDKLQSDAGRAILDTRIIVPTKAPPETVAKTGGLDFANELVAENYVNQGRQWHGFEMSYRPQRVVVDTEPRRIRSGGSSIRMTLLPGDCGWTTHRGAGEWNDCLPYGNERVETISENVPVGEWYYGFAIMLGSDLALLPGYTIPSAMSEINLYQWFQTDTGACFDIVYNTRLKQLGVTIHCRSGEFEVNYLRLMLPESSTDKWHDFVVHANWSTDPKRGFFKLLQNGKLVMDYAGPTLAGAGGKSIGDHPQIYAYGESKESPAAMQYRSAVTVWFDDMMRSKSLSEIRQRYQFADTAFSDLSAVQPEVDLDPALRGATSLYAEGEVDNLPPGAIGPGAKLPESVVKGFKDAVRGRKDNAKAYGLALVPDPAGGTNPVLRFEVRPGDCGKEALSDWDDCEHGQEASQAVSATVMRSGEHYVLAWKMLVEGPEWGISPGQVALLQLAHPEFDYELAVTSSGLTFGPGNEPRRTFAFDFYDEWNDFVLDVVWSKGKKGRISLTVNGKQVYSSEGPTLPHGEARPNFGILRDGFKNITSVVYFKDVVLTKVE